MFTLSRLRRARKKIDADYSRELAKLRKAKASPEQVGKPAPKTLQNEKAAYF